MAHGQINYDQLRNGGAVIKTGNYTIVESDAGCLIASSPSGSPLTTYAMTLPATPSGFRRANWFVSISNYGGGIVTVSPNGNNLDGSASSISLTAGQGVVIFTDGTNYFTEGGRGSGGGGTTILLQTNSVNNGNQSKLNLAQGSNVTLTDNGSGTVTIAAATAAGALVQLAQNVLSVSAASVTFSAISGSYTNLVLTMMARTDVATTNQAVYMQFNGDTAANYDREFISGFGATVTSGQQTAAAQVFIGAVAAANNTAGAVGVMQARVFSYARATFWKQALAQGGDFGDNTSMGLFPIWFNWRSTAAITSILLAPSSGNFIAGSVFTLYGES